MTFILDKLRYFFVFITTRGLLFFAPLVIANYISIEQYGILEWSFAFATILASVLAFGTNSLVPLVSTGIAPPGVTFKSIYFHHLLMVVAAMALVLLLINSDKALIVLLLFMAVALRSLYSIKFKSIAQPEKSLIIDSSLFGMMMIVVLVVDAFNSGYEYQSIWIFTSLYSAVLVIILVALYFNLNSVHERIQWKHALIAGAPLMISGVISTLVITSGKLGIGLFFEEKVMGEYAFLSRVGALPIVLYQIIIVSIFREIFTKSEYELGNLCFKIMLLIVVGVPVIWVMSPYLDHIFGNVFRTLFEGNSSALYLLLTQSLLWCGIALNDLVNSRFKTARSVLNWTAPTLFLLLVVTFIFINLNDYGMNAFIIAHSIIILVFFSVQSVTMFFKGVKLLKFWLLSVSSYIFLTLTAVFIG
jgi:O-antigen/teichoic acid export membrane protein